jgi:hypothetical protein
VTAAAALLVARAEQRSTPLDGIEIRRLLVESAAPFSGPAVTGCGAGVLDACDALQKLDAYINDSLPDDSGDVEESEPVLAHQPGIQ